MMSQRIDKDGTLGLSDNRRRIFAGGDEHGESQTVAEIALPRCLRASEENTEVWRQNIMAIEAFLIRNLPSSFYGDKTTLSVRARQVGKAIRTGNEQSAKDQLQESVQ